MKGTGSPQKKLQGQPRGPATTSEPAVAQTRSTFEESGVASRRQRQHDGHPVHKRVIPAPHGISSSAKNVNVNDSGAVKDNFAALPVPRKKNRNEPQPTSAKQASANDGGADDDDAEAVGVRRAQKKAHK